MRYLFGVICQFIVTLIYIFLAIVYLKLGMKFFPDLNIYWGLTMIIWPVGIILSPVFISTIYFINGSLWLINYVGI